MCVPKKIAVIFEVKKITVCIRSSSIINLCLKKTLKRVDQWIKC